MKFGNCVNLVEAAKNRPQFIHDMKKWRFDFVEASFAALTTATEEEFEAAVALAKEADMPVPVCNGMFPGATIRIAGDDRDPEAVKEYVEKGFTRAKKLGVQYVVLGSDKARQLPDGYDQDQAYEEFIELIKEAIVPACEKHEITILIEPLRKPVNFINTLADGMRVVYGVNSPWVKLLADTIHMITSGEDPKYVHEIKDYIKHVHVSDWNRALPEFKYSSELCAVLRELKKSGYDGTYSFEAMAGADYLTLHRSLLTLKQRV